MTASLEPKRPAARAWWRNATTVRIVLAAAFAALLLGTDYAAGQWAHVIASTAGFIAAVTLVGIAVLAWERIVTTAQSAGLVETAAC